MFEVNVGSAFSMVLDSEETTRFASKKLGFRCGVRGSRETARLTKHNTQWRAQLL